MLKRWIYGAIVVVLVAPYTLLDAQESPENAAAISYNGVAFSYVPEAFGAVLPDYDEGTPYQTDAPYFANVAPHASFKFMRPDPARPDLNWTGELRVYRIADLEAYAEPTYHEVLDQLRTLDTANLSAHLKAVTDEGLPGMPFMPVLNATQVFWTHPDAIRSENTAGVEYFAYYSVIPEPIVDGQILYAYQAISADGSYYISFSMPIETGLLDSTPPESVDLDTFVAGYPAYIEAIFATLNNADPATFSPTRNELTRFVESISFGG